MVGEVLVLVLERGKMGLGKQAQWPCGRGVEGCSSLWVCFDGANKLKSQFSSMGALLFACTSFCMYGFGTGSVFE